MRSQLEVTYEDGTWSEKSPASSLVTSFLQAAHPSLFKLNMKQLQTTGQLHPVYLGSREEHYSHPQPGTGHPPHYCS
ncbi:rCG61366 [Rattus norvegicus]|uniref:RCG61366 n=1 Tax=Rattus norvegicus TaxID=10116 RepID=A6HBN8_RAT|nr:rCG61366 [Rattus norvegicus]